VPPRTRGYGERVTTPQDERPEGTTPAAADVPDDALQQEIADEVAGGGAGPVKGTVDPPVKGAGEGLQGER
jgi:hypothetical protein